MTGHCRSRSLAARGAELLHGFALKTWDFFTLCLSRQAELEP